MNEILENEYIKLFIAIVVLPLSYRFICYLFSNNNKEKKLDRFIKYKDIYKECAVQKKKYNNGKEMDTFINNNIEYLINRLFTNLISENQQRIFIYFSNRIKNYTDIRLISRLTKIHKNKLKLNWSPLMFSILSFIIFCFMYKIIFPSKNILESLQYILKIISSNISYSDILLPDLILLVWLLIFLTITSLFMVNNIFDYIIYFIIRSKYKKELSNAYFK